MAVFQSSPSLRKSPYTNDWSLHASSLSRSGLINETLHSTRSLSGRSSIMTYKNKQYASASDALAAYISDFEDTHPLHSSYHRTVEDLFSPRSVLLQTVDRSLDTGVRDTRAEWKRYISKKLIDESYSEIITADLAQEKAQALMESSSLLGSGLSPLPGSSLITEGESEASLSTDALLLAPPYPQLNHQKPSGSQKVPSRKSFNWKKHDHKKENIQQDTAPTLNDVGKTSLFSKTLPTKSLLISKFPPRISPVRRLATSRASPDKTLKSKRVLFERRHLHSRRSLDEDGKGVRRTEGLGGMSSRTTSPVKRETLKLSKHPPTRQKLNKDGQRPPPSWIQDLNESGVTSLASGIQASGKAPPSWVQEMDMSSIHGFEQDGRRPPPSWIQDLDLSLASKQHGQIYTSHQVNLGSYGLDEEFLVSQKVPVESNPRSSSASDLLTSDSLAPPNVEKDLNPTRRISRSMDRENSKGTSTRALTSKRDEKFHEGVVHLTKRSSLTKADSFTTDDLILASPTGKGFHVPSPNTRGRYMQQRVTSPDDLLLNVDRQNGYEHTENHRTPWKENLESTRRTLGKKINSDSGKRKDVLSSTPKHTVHGESDAVSQSLNREVHHKTRSPLWSGSGYRHQIAARLEVDQQREDVLLERAEKVLHAARAPQDQGTYLYLPHHHDDDERHDDAGRHDNSLLTEEILEGDRPWERNLPSHKATKVAFSDSKKEREDRPDIVTKFLDDCLQSVSENQKLTGGYQPGPVEALKNMLFTLQGIAPSTDQTTPSKSHPGVENGIVRTESSSSPQLKDGVDKDSTSSESATAFEDPPGGKSLQRAMEHLSRLKVLVNGGSLQNSQPSSAS